MFLWLNGEWNYNYFYWEKQRCVIEGTANRNPFNTLGFQMSMSETNKKGWSKWSSIFFFESVRRWWWNGNFWGCLLFTTHCWLFQQLSFEGSMVKFLCRCSKMQLFVVTALRRNTWPAVTRQDHTGSERSNLQRSTHFRLKGSLVKPLVKTGWITLIATLSHFLIVELSRRQYFGICVVRGF